MFYKKTKYKVLGFEKSKRKHKKYDALLQDDDKYITRVPFGDNRYQSFRDKTGLNLYEIHGDPKRRVLYRKRHRGFLKEGYYSPGWFSYFVLW